MCDATSPSLVIVTRVQRGFSRMKRRSSEGIAFAVRGRNIHRFPLLSP